MKKPKRQYKHKESLQEPVSTSEISTALPIKEESSSKIPSVVTDADILMLPFSLKYQLENQTKFRKLFHLKDNLKERTEQAVRRFRGY